MQLRIGPVLSVPNRPRGQVIEARADDIGADHMLPPAATPRQRVMLNFRDGTVYRGDVSADQPAIIPDERLDTY